LLGKIWSIDANKLQESLLCLDALTNGASGRSNRADPREPLVLLLANIEHWRAGDYVPAQQRLRHRIDLVVMGAVRKRGAFLDKFVHPGCAQRMRQASKEFALRRFALSMTEWIPTL
jgi:hypothetical protein